MLVILQALIKKMNASVAQSVEQGTENPCVGGSIPPRGTNFIAGVAQLAEQLICNQQVAGSIPVTSSTTLSKNLIYGRVPEWPKGTDCKSVVSDFGGSNPPPSTKLSRYYCIDFLLFIVVDSN